MLIKDNTTFEVLPLHWTCPSISFQSFLQKPFRNMHNISGHRMGKYPNYFVTRDANMTVLDHKMLSDSNNGMMRNV